jgi:flagellin
LRPILVGRSENRDWSSMPLNSINTNAGALVALQSLGAINAELFEVQRRISTGLKISSVKDNPAIWAIAQNQRSEVKAYDAVIGSLQRGQSIADVAMTAGEAISDTLSEMKEKMLAASDPSLSASERAAISEDYVMLRKRIDQIAVSADFDGVNLISAGSTGAVKALANTKATSTIDIDHVDLSTTGSLLSGLKTDLTSVVPTDIDALTTAMNGVNAAVSRLGTGSKALDTHLTFVRKLQDTMEAAVGRLVDADMAKESARLQSLQIKQQLAFQALSIANSAPSLLLQLFQRR